MKSAVAIAFALILAAVSAAQAQSVEQFYKGRQLTMIAFIKKHGSERRAQQ